MVLHAAGPPHSSSLHYKLFYGPCCSPPHASSSRSLLSETRSRDTGRSSWQFMTFTFKTTFPNMHLSNTQQHKYLGSSVVLGPPSPCDGWAEELMLQAHPPLRSPALMSVRHESDKIAQLQLPPSFLSFLLGGKLQGKAQELAKKPSHIARTLQTTMSSTTMQSTS